ncbi:MAG: hypothetical protein HRU28_18390 [Rhizobiales bacterium]|nr:hypothetical protein [Hyphomicrobiales bacterium]
MSKDTEDFMAPELRVPVWIDGNGERKTDKQHSGRDEDVFFNTLTLT